MYCQGESISCPLLSSWLRRMSHIVCVVTGVKDPQQPSCDHKDFIIIFCLRIMKKTFPNKNSALKMTFARKLSLWEVCFQLTVHSVVMPWSLCYPIASSRAILRIFYLCFLQNTVNDQNISHKSRKSDSSRRVCHLMIIRGRRPSDSFKL